MTKITDSEQQCKDNSRKAIEESNTQNEANLAKAKEAMDAHRANTLVQQKSDLDTRIAQVLEDQQRIYLEKERLHDLQRSRALEKHNQAEEWALSLARW